MEINEKTGSLGAPGCPAIQDRLLRYLKSERIHPALLLVGPDKSTKFQVAKGMTKFLFCQKREALAFCGNCSTCRRIDKEIHPDVYLFKDDGEDTLKIETVREVTGQMNVSPIEGPNKVCVIEEAHRMNSGAANAFLKTLEEPGVGRYFILTTTQIGSLLPTILSRCIEFTFRPETQSLSLSLEETQKYDGLLKSLYQTKDISIALSALDKKEETLQFLQFLQWNLRESLINPHLGTNIPSYFKGLSPFNLTTKFEEVLKLEGRLRSNANYGLMLESLLRQHFVGI